MTDIQIGDVLTFLIVFSIKLFPYIFFFNYEALPSGCYGRLAPRSGLAHKNFIDVGGNLISSNYCLICLFLTEII